MNKIHYLFKFLKMNELKKALVTGADGVIGSHLIEFMLEKGILREIIRMLFMIKIIVRFL